MPGWFNWGENKVLIIFWCGILINFCFVVDFAFHLDTICFCKDANGRFLGLYISIFLLLVLESRYEIREICHRIEILFIKIKFVCFRVLLVMLEFCPTVGTVLKLNFRSLQL